ncbi:hypothetical protein RKD48_006255 [Streptomyces ambofaciens]
MSPPPPPLGRGRKRAAQTFDEALDDAELISVRAALAQGRWQSVRSLLVHTGDDWDRRGHRMAVLAKEPHCAPWAREWLLAEPDSADASALLALALVHRALRGKEKPARVREACRDAAALVPDDPTPWLGLLMLERSLGTDEDVIRVFDEVRGRYADHHHAHHLMVARLAERGDGGGPDPLHEVYDFANWAAEQAPRRLPAGHPPRRRTRRALPRAGRRRSRVPRPGRLGTLGRPARPAGDEGGLRLVAGVGAGRPPAPADRPQLPRPRQVLRGPRRRGRRPVPPHRRARHSGPVVVPGP